MENNSKTASDILLEAANLLEYQKDWRQGSFFSPSEETGCAMCAHGAIMYAASPEMKDRVDKSPAVALVGTTATAPSRATAVATGTETDYYENKAKQENLSLPDYIRKNCQGEWGLAHYLAAKAGLTYTYNDTPGRTKQEVIDKLREAAHQSIE